MLDNSCVWHLVTLGPSHISRGDAVLRLTAFETAALAALGVESTRCGREDLAELLWGQVDQAAKHRLRQLRYSVRRKLCVDPFAFARDSLLSVDAALCLSAARRGDALTAVRLHRGLFLADLPALSPQFCDWRDAYSDTLQAAVRTAAHAATITEHDPEAVVELTSWLDAYDGLTSHEHIARIHAFLGLGQIAEGSVAIVRAQECDLEHSAQMRISELADQLKQGQDASRSLPFVGRDEIQAQLGGFLTPGSATRVVLITGPCGIGKSRTLDWASRYAALHGAHVHQAQIAPLGTAVPPLAAARRIFLRHPQYSQAFLRPARPDAMINVALCAARLATEWNHKWRIIAVDNMNFADVATWRLLSLLVDRSAGTDIQLVCAGSGDPCPDLLDWSDRLAVECQSIELLPLPDDVMHRLLDAALMTGGQSLHRSARSEVMQHAAGIPRRLLQLTELKAVEATSETESLSVTLHKAQQLITGLSHCDQEIARVLLVTGFPLSESLLHAAVDRPASFHKSLANLLTAGILRRSDGGIYFRNSLVHSAAGILLQYDACREIRARLAGIFAILKDFMRAADYSAAAGDTLQSVVYRESAAAQAAAFGEYLIAERQLGLALKGARTSEEFLRVSRAAGHLYLKLGRWDDCLPHFLPLPGRTPDEELGVAVGQIAAEPHLTSDNCKILTTRISAAAKAGASNTHICRAYLHAIDKAYHSGTEHIPVAAFFSYIDQHVGRNACDRAEMLSKAARVNILFADASRATDQAEASVAASEQCGDPVTLQGSYNTRAVIRMCKGQYDAALEDFHRCEEIADTANLVYLRDRYSNNLAILYYEAGNVTEARDLLRASLKLDQHVVSYAITNLAILEMLAGDRSGSMAYCSRLITGPSRSSALMGLSIMGLQSLDEGEVEAGWCRREIVTRIGDANIPLTDPTYTAIFLARTSSSVDYGKELIAKHADRMTGRNIYSELRLRLEYASLVSREDQQQAVDLLQSVIIRTASAGAHWIRLQGEAQLRRLQAGLNANPRRSYRRHR